jgi:HEPN domain-containing protein
MKPTTAEWVVKAEGDYLTASRELAVKEGPNHDAVTFHAQQRAEKYLKASLIEAGIPFPKTHDLCRVLDLAVGFEPRWESLRPQLEALTDLGVEIRYPSAFADVEDASDAFATAQQVREAVRKHMGLI